MGIHILASAVESSGLTGVTALLSRVCLQVTDKKIAIPRRVTL